MSEDQILKVVTVGNASSVKGGITSVISQILSHNWCEQNIEMRFIPTFEGGSSVDKIKSFLKGYFQLRKGLKKGHVDVAHIHMSHAGSFIRKRMIHRLCQKYGIPDIIHLHSSGFVDFYNQSSARAKRQITELLTDCSCVIALGKEWEQRVLRIAPKANVKILNNTVHIPETASDQDVECVSFLYLGVLVKRKGVIDLLQAIGRLKDKGLLESGKVFFNIGGTGECEDELRGYVADKDLGHLVHFLGWVAGEEKAKQLQTNQVLVLPSYNEGLPIAILEAISYGMPVVATDVGCVAEAVHDRENGYLYKPGDIDALTKALEKLITLPELRKEMALKSRKLAEEEFNDFLYFDQLSALYHQVVG